jgi:hypothetical protein
VKNEPPKVTSKVPNWQHEYALFLKSLRLELVKKGYTEADKLGMPSEHREFIMALIPNK